MIRYIILYLAKWRTAWFCITCDKELTRKEVIYNYGRCPYCGYKGKNASIFIEVYEKAYQFVKVGSLWKFWQPIVKRKYKEEQVNKKHAVQNSQWVRR
jgi:hypothetical protein